MIYLSRHGLRLNKVIKSYNGDPNVPIHNSDIGNLVLESQKIENLDYVFCSPFLRCVQTAHYLNRFDAPIFIEYGLSETMREKWFKKCGYNPLNRLHNSYELSLHYYNVDPSYDTVISQSFPEGRRQSRKRTKQFIEWFKQSEFVDKDVLFVGHAFSIKDCLSNFGITSPFQCWSCGLPPMSKLFFVENEQVKQ